MKRTQLQLKFSVKFSAMLTLCAVSLTFSVPASGAHDPAQVTHNISGPPLPAGTARRTADRAFWLMTAASVGATVADVENTQYALRHGAREANPLYGSHPSRQRMYEVAMPLTGLATWLSYRWKHQDDHDQATYGYTAKVRWYAVPLVNIGMHGFAVGLTIGLTGR